MDLGDDKSIRIVGAWLGFCCEVEGVEKSKWGSLKRTMAFPMTTAKKEQFNNKHNDLINDWNKGRRLGLYNLKGGTKWSKAERNKQAN